MFLAGSIGLLGAALLGSWAALAVDRSADTQLVTPTLKPGGAFTVDSPRAMERGLVQGLALQWERQPLAYYEGDQYVAPAIGHRETLHLGVAVPVGARVSAWIRGSAVNMAPGPITLAAPERALALGDLELGAMGTVWEGDGAAFGAGLSVWLPTGHLDSWVAESLPRYGPYMLAEATVGPVLVMSRLGLVARAATDSDLDFLLGTELVAGLAGLLPLGERLSLIGELSSRHGLSNFMRAGAENPALLLGGVRLPVGRRLGLDMALGTGVGEGYGTSDLRALVSLVRRPGPEPAPQAPVEVYVPPVEAAEPEVTTARVEPPPPPPPPPKATRATVSFKDTLAFQPGRPTLLPGSEPVLASMAEAIAAHPQLEHVVIEASVSGGPSPEEAWKLSMERGRVVFEALVERGVAPARLSWRGLGLHGGEDEAVLRVARMASSPEDVSEERQAMLVLPWSGEEVPLLDVEAGLLGRDAHPALVWEEEEEEEEEEPEVSPLDHRQFLDMLNQEEEE